VFESGQRRAAELELAVPGDLDCVIKNFDDTDRSTASIAEPGHSR
jgi:hypothetical protein